MTETSTRHITFILPCAGEGRRLGFNGHKELFPILPGVRLIDFSLAHIREAQDWILDNPGWMMRVAVVIRPGKSEVAEYVKQSLQGVTVLPVMFDTALHEWPGSVHSARLHYGDINLVLLPDSRLSLSPNEMTRDLHGGSLAECVIGSLKNYSVTFGYIPCDNPYVLQHFGAIRVLRHCKDYETIDRFQDKPDRDFASYNGYWCCYGFRAEAGEFLYRFLIRSVIHEPADIWEESFHPASAFPVHDYQDLGTREAVDLFRSRETML